MLSVNVAHVIQSEERSAARNVPVNHALTFVEAAAFSLELLEVKTGPTSTRQMKNIVK